MQKPGLRFEQRYCSCQARRNTVDMRAILYMWALAGGNPGQATANADSSGCDRPAIKVTTTTGEGIL